MKIKSILSLIIAAAASAFPFVNASAQEQTPPEGYEYADSLVYIPYASVDSTLVGQDVFADMPSSESGDAATVSVGQSELVEKSMRRHIESNAGRPIPGYRVRIFFDNSQSARTESEKTLKKFREMFEGVAVYRTYTNPYFKVTVGDCRTKSEAMHLLTRIKRHFPSAFVVKENIECPIVGDEKAYIIDTIRVLRPVAAVYQ